MLKTLYLIRHCKASGQAADAALTAAGEIQAEQLAYLLADRGIERIISSPFVRARRSIEPLAARLELPIEEDERLAERVLASADMPDWLDLLRATFDDFDLSFAGGESNRVAMARGVAVIDEALAHPAATTAIVSHGNLLTLLLHHFDQRFGFAEWQALTNPDVFCVQVENGRSMIQQISISRGETE